MCIRDSDNNALKELKDVDQEEMSFSLDALCQALPKDCLLYTSDVYKRQDFDGSSLNEHNWSRIDYVGYNAPDWRKYQSRDESLVEFREKDGNSAMTVWGKYGDYTCLLYTSRCV